MATPAIKRDVSIVHRLLVARSLNDQEWTTRYIDKRDYVSLSARRDGIIRARADLHLIEKKKGK